MTAATRKQKETETLREQVLDKAEEIFVQEGIGRVTMRRIAAGVDYAPTVLYRLFANKADLIDHLIARGYNGVREYYETASAQNNLDPKEQFKNILSAYVDYALSHPNHYQMWFETGSVRLDGHQLRMTHGRLKFIVYQVWLDNIEACQSKGSFTGWDTLTVFQVLWSRVHGLISLRLQHPDMPWIPVARQLDSVLSLNSN